MSIELIGPWLLKVVLLVVGTALLARGTYALIQAVASRRWPRVEGEIVASEIDVITLRGAGEIIHTTSGYVPKIKYRFPLNGETLHGSRIAVGEKITGAPYHFAKAQADRYQPGSKVTVFYHPQKPSIAALKPGRPAPSLVPLLTGITLVALGLLATWICHTPSL